MKRQRHTTTTQVRDMRAKWPEFRVELRDRHQAVWKGELRPFHKTYTVCVGIRFALPGTGVPKPLALVLNPRLHRRRETPDEAIPHVYNDPRDPLLPVLCLHHPPTDRFDPRHQSAADTVVPWTIDWLACYEIWLATGRWVGGGVSH